MDNLLQFSVNIAMEATVALVLILLLCTLIKQKKAFPTTKPLIYLSWFTIGVLINQILTWTIFLHGLTYKYVTVIMIFIYVLDYFFSYGASAAFYFYIEALIIQNYRKKQVLYRSNKTIEKFIIGWGIVTTLIYGVLLFVPDLYRIEDGVIYYNSIAYIILHIMAKFASVCALILIIRHRKVLDKHETRISIIFILLVAAFFVIDEIWEVCIGHVLSAVFAVFIYVSVDLHKGLLLERQERELVEKKTQIMFSQMQPHFLYNVLTTISGMCEVENAMQARDIVNRFADYFRANLDSLGSEKLISFDKELEHVKTYLWLEKVRFEEQLNVRYEITVDNFYVPSLTIQPMVENAVKHGILPKEEAGTVTIRTCETEDEYIVSIEDDGVGFDVNDYENDGRNHIGIENVRKRLEIICNGVCEINSEIGKGTTVSIHIPKGEQL